MTDDFVVEQLSVSTAEDEQNYFSDTPPTAHQPSPNSILPAGLYRVVDGSLYRLVGGGGPGTALPPGPASSRSPESAQH